jgi:2-C-methyl-D-erythritol 4-phosphate cytidylyltransferase
MTDERYWGLMPAAGAGRRVGGPVPKQYLQIHGRWVIEIALERLLQHPALAMVCVVVATDAPAWDGSGLAGHPRVLRAVGGVERCHSVLNGLAVLAARAHPKDWVLVHDAARPCLRREDLHRLIDEASGGDGGLLAVPLSDTLKRDDGTGCVAGTLPRGGLWRAFTPQMFRLGPLQQALLASLREGRLVTDEASAMEAAGYRPRLVEGHADNIKITRPEDLPLVEFFLHKQKAEDAHRPGF